MGDQGASVLERLEDPAPLVARRLLPVGRGAPGDLATLDEGDDVVVAHSAVAVGHDEHVADGADPLAGLGACEVVVAVPARLLGRVGDEVEEGGGGGGDLAGGRHDGVGVHDSIVPSRGAVSSKTSIDPA